MDLFHLRGNAFKAAAIGQTAVRRFASGASHEEHVKTMLFWKKVSYACFPVLAVVGAYNIYVVNAHGHPHRSEIDYDHLRFRKKPYPWECSDCNLFDRKCHRDCKAALRAKE